MAHHHYAGKYPGCPRAAARLGICTDTRKKENWPKIKDTQINPTAQDNMATLGDCPTQADRLYLSCLQWKLDYLNGLQCDNKKGSGTGVTTELMVHQLR